MKKETAKKGQHGHKKQSRQAVKTTTRKDYASYWLIAGVLLTLVVYLPSLTNGITNWDDAVYLTNPYVKNLSPAGIIKIFSVYFLGNYHPLTLISIGADRLIGGDNPFIFHFTNLLLHLFNTVLVYLFVRRLTKNDLLAALTFILYGVHPMHVESVAWVSERKDVLYSLFFLLSLYAYTTYASSRKWGYYMLSLLFFLLSLLSKGQAVILAAILPFIDYMKDRKWFSIKVLSEKILFFLLALIFGWVALRIQAWDHAVGFTYFSKTERLAFASYGLTQYLIKSIIPVGLSALYPYPSRLSGGNIPSFYWLFIITIPLYFVGLYFLSKRSKIYAFGLSMFILCLFPLLQLIPVGGAIMADRYFYIPSVGLLLCFALGLTEIKQPLIRNALFVLFILVFSSLSFSRNMVWKDSMTLWNDVISKSAYPQDVAFNNRGEVYSNSGHFEKAIADFSSAIGANPGYLIAWYNRGTAYGNLGQWDKAEADWSRVIAINPEYNAAYANRGLAYINLGQWGKAIVDCSRAIEIDPKNIKAYSNRAVAYIKLGQWNLAIDDCTRTIGLDPNYTDAYINRGFTYANLGEWEKAIDDYSRAIEIDPENAIALSNRDIAYSKLKSRKK